MVVVVVVVVVEVVVVGVVLTSTCGFLGSKVGACLLINLLSWR